MKKLLCIVAVLLALSLVLIPAPTASAAGQEPGDLMTFTYTRHRCNEGKGIRRQKKWQT